MALYYRPKAVGDSRSAGLGQAVGSGLRSLLGQMIERKRMQGPLQALGVPGDVAASVASLPAPLQQQFMQQFLGSEAFMPTQTAEGVPLVQQLPGEAPALQQLLGAEEGLGAAQIVPGQEVGDLSQLSPEMRDEAVREAKRQAPTELAKRQIERAATPNTVAQAIKQSPLQQKPAAQKSFRELLATPRPTASDRAKAKQELRKQKLEDAKMDLQERKFKFKQQQEIDKQTQKDYDKIKDMYRGAVENDWRLDKLDTLARKGDLADPRTAALIKAASLKGYGVDLSSLMSADSQEFQKISNDFIKNAKAIFGARVTEGEIRLFLQTVPNLFQTNEGKRRVIRNMKLFNQASKAKFKAMNDIIEMNGGERPKNLGTLVEKRVKPQMDAIGKKFAELISFEPRKIAEKVNKQESRGWIGGRPPMSAGELGGEITRNIGRAARYPVDLAASGLRSLISGLVGQ